MLPSDIAKLKLHLESAILGLCGTYLPESSSTKLDGHVCITVDASKLVWIHLSEANGQAHIMEDCFSYSLLQEAETEVNLFRQLVMDSVMNVCSDNLHYSTSMQVEIFMAVILNHQSLVLVTFDEMYGVHGQRSLAPVITPETKSGFPFNLKQISPMSKNISSGSAHLTLKITKSKSIIPKEKNNEIIVPADHKEKENIVMNEIQNEDLGMHHVTVKQEPGVSFVNKDLELVTISNQELVNTDLNEEVLNINGTDYKEAEVDGYYGHEEQDVSDYEPKSKRKKSKRKFKTPKKVKNKQPRRTAKVGKKENKITAQEKMDTRACRNKKTLKTRLNIEDTRYLPTTKETFECRTCGKQFISERILKRHTKLHDSKPCNECQECGNFFSENAALVHHMQTHILVKSFVCMAEGCRKSFIEQHSLNEHMAKHTGMKKFKCNICGERYASKSSLNTHIKSCHEHDVLLKCRLCNSEFSSTDLLAKHTKLNHSDSCHICKLCNKKFLTKATLKSHEFRHSGNRNFQCEQCKSLFYSKYDLRRHLLCHQDIRPFPCALCNKKYRTKRTLIEHSRIHSGERPFHCDLCQNQFMTKDALSKHKRSHSNERPHSCPVCFKSFKTAACLKSHKYVHIPKDELPFVCNLCTGRFTTASSLKLHIRYHTNDRRHVCELCGKSFIELGTLKDHLVWHKGELPFTCEYCGKGCSQRSNLKVHMRSCKQRPKDTVLEEKKIQKQIIIKRVPNEITCSKLDEKKMDDHKYLIQDQNDFCKKLTDYLPSTLTQHKYETQPLPALDKESNLFNPSILPNPHIDI